MKNNCTKSKIKINSSFIRLDSFLKLVGEASTGGQAKFLIQSGAVLVNHASCSARGKKLFDGDIIDVNSNLYEVEAFKD